MKAIKLTLLAASVVASGAAVAGPVHHATTAVTDSTKTIFSTLTNPAAVSVEVGSLGYGANIGWAISDTAELQAGWAGGNVTDLLNGDIKVDGAVYDVKTDFSNPYLGVQVRPAANWFTVGTGVIVPRNEIKVALKKNEGAEIKMEGDIYNADNVRVEGKLKHKNKMAPYLTVGFRPNLNNNWGVFGELGGAYMGNVEADVRVVDGVVTKKAQNAFVPVLSNDEFQDRAERAIVDKKYATWYPIAKLGVTYRF